MATLFLFITLGVAGALVLIQNCDCSPRLQMRLKVFESRLNTLEMRLTVDATHRNDEMTHVLQQLAEMNNTLMEIEEKFADPVTGNVENQLALPGDAYPDREKAGYISVNDKAIISALKDEKLFIRESIERIYSALDVFERGVAGKIDTRFKTLLEDVTNESLKSGLEEVRANLSDSLNEMQEQLTEGLHELRLETIDSFAKYKKQILEFEREQTKKETQMNAMKKEFEQKVEALRGTIDSRFQKLFECPDHWTRYDLFCYLFFNSPVQFNKARELCADVGSYVVDVQDRRELEFVMGLVRGSNFWIGLTDSDTEGTWKWDRTNAVTSFT